MMKHTTSTSITIPNNYEPFDEITNDHIEVDQENLQEMYSFNDQCEHNQPTEIDYDEPSVFCHNTDNSSIDESGNGFSDDEHSDVNLDKASSETKLNFR